MSKWEMVELGDLCSLRNGKAYNSKVWSKSGYPIIRIQNLNDSQKSFNYWPGALNKEVHVIPGDLLIAWSGTPGTSFGAHIWKGPEGVLNQHIFKVSLEGKVESSWMKFCINRQLMKLIDQAHGGVGLKHVTKGTVESLQIPLPPLPEQKRIARILDQADALRAKRREAIAKLDTFLQSTFLDMFGDPVTNPKGWEVSPFGEIVGDSFRNGISPSSKGKYVGKVLTLSAVTGSNFNPNSIKEALFEKKPTIHQSVLSNIFLICRGNGNINLVGRGFFPNKDLPSVYFPDTIIGAQIEADWIEKKFVESFWKSNFVRIQIKRGAQTTNGTYKINQKLLSSIKMVIPPLKLQNQFAEIVTRVEVQKQKMREHLTQLDTLFASLQSRAFNGDL